MEKIKIELSIDEFWAILHNNKIELEEFIIELKKDG